MAIYSKVVVPSDTATLDQPGEIYVGGAGNLKVITDGGDTVTFVGVLKGTILPVLVAKVFSTGTTATNLVVNF